MVIKKKTELNIENLNLMSNAIRILSMDAVEKANSGHPGMPMGMSDVATILFSIASFFTWSYTWYKTPLLLHRG